MQPSSFPDDVLAFVLHEVLARGGVAAWCALRATCVDAARVSRVALDVDAACSVAERRHAWYLLCVGITFPCDAVRAMTGRKDAAEDDDDEHVETTPSGGAFALPLALPLACALARGLGCVDDDADALVAALSAPLHVPLPYVRTPSVGAIRGALHLLVVLVEEATREVLGRWRAALDVVAVSFTVDRDPTNDRRCDELVLRMPLPRLHERLRCDAATAANRALQTRVVLLLADDAARARPFVRVGCPPPRRASVHALWSEDDRRRLRVCARFTGAGARRWWRGGDDACELSVGLQHFEYDVPCPWDGAGHDGRYARLLRTLWELT